MVFEVSIDLLDQLRVVRTFRIEPENCWCISCTCASYSEFHPITNRCIFYLTCAPDIALLNCMFMQNLTRSVTDTNGARCRNFKRLIMRAILFGLLSHQPNIWHSTHGARIKRAVCFTKINGRRINACIAAIRNNKVGVLLSTILIPHLTRRTNRGWH